MIEDAEVWARVRPIYDGFLAGDTDGVDALLQRDVTIWDAAEFPLHAGLDNCGICEGGAGVIRGHRR